MKIESRNLCGLQGKSLENIRSGQADLRLQLLALAKGLDCGKVLAVMLGVGACLCFVLRFEIVYLALTESKILQEGYQPVLGNS